jgi:peptidoglycan hydrolase-like protein with peptidoglycan-binding domain
MSKMKTMKKHDKGAGVEDVQQRLFKLGYLEKSQISALFDDNTLTALSTFCAEHNLEDTHEVSEKVWAFLVDATFNLGDRTLYLRMPYFHGHDVFELQRALSALGFACGALDGIFGVHTEAALRKFQLNLGLPSDGIAGAFTYGSLHNLQHSWQDKETVAVSQVLGFARVADVLERNTLCLFGTDEFSRSVAGRMSNLALATNPASKILSADDLSVSPDESMLLVHIVLPEGKTQEGVGRVSFDSEDTLALRLETALLATTTKPPRIALELPSEVWQDAGTGRSAQHFAIALLDALCLALCRQ